MVLYEQLYGLHKPERKKMDNQNTTKEAEKKAVPPYMSWMTFIGYIKSLSQGIPDPIDTSSMLSLNGNNRSWTMGALRFFNLIDKTNRPETSLRNLVDAINSGNETTYQSTLQNLLKSSYTFLFQQGYDLTTSSPAAFSQKFRDAGLSGDTCRKGEVFFLEAAKEAGISISIYIIGARKKGPKAISGGTGSKPRKKIPGGDKRFTGHEDGNQNIMLNTLASKFPEFDPNWSPDAQEAWFSMYGRLLELTDGVGSNKKQTEDENSNQEGT